MGYPVRDLNSFTETVQKNFHNRRTNWTIVFLANACSDSRASRYIIENFSIMDELSNEINFYLPGYSASNLKKHHNVIEEHYENWLDERNYALYQQMRDASFDEFQKLLERLINSRVIRQKEFQGIRDTINELDQLSYYNKNTDYKGDGIAIIKSKRLGNVIFNDAEFSSFILEFSSRCKEYVYQGGCDMIILQTLEGKISYENAIIYNLDIIIDCPNGPSLDSFVYHVFNIFRGEFFSVNDRHISPSEIIENIRRRPNTRNDEFIEQLERDLRRMSNPFLSMFHRSERPTIDDVLFKLDKYLLKSQIDELYKEATFNNKTKEEPYQIIIRREIEQHLHWNLDEEFYFISYSNQDTSKAMMVKALLERRNKHVWIAPDGIPQGRDYSSVISNTLYRCRKFVLLLTKSSARSRWVMRELDIAISRDFDTQIKIIFTDNFTAHDIQEFPELYFYINKVQGRFSFDDIYSSEELLTKFIEE